ncbi:MAG TPA: class D beta-lactamase [Candidatus Kapabacteria bacterium]|nr:class D beta-lactamase [Candidatus Kapabacteria bacterium]
MKRSATLAAGVLLLSAAVPGGGRFSPAGRSPLPGSGAEQAVHPAPAVHPMQAGAESRPPHAASESIDLAPLFERHNVTGCMALYDMNAGRSMRYNAGRCATRFLPASTFKIFNSLVALETGSIADEHTVIRWDSVDRHNPGWNQDMDMQTAFRRSAVWFYQELARRAGERRMKHFIVKEGYGNRNISGGIDRFWLTGRLRISADEQIAFLRRLYLHRLASFSERTMSIVNSIMLMEDTLGYRLRWKTGWGTQEGRQIGWIVGYLEKDGNVWFFALNFESRDPKVDVPAVRMDILRSALRELKLL